MHRWRPYLLTVVVTAALLAVVAATVMIFGREQIVFEEHIAEFDRLAELKIDAATRDPINDRTWLRGSSIAPQEARDLITRLHLSAADVRPKPHPEEWEFYAIKGAGYGDSRYFVLSADTTQRDTSRAIATSRLGGWWYESDRPW